MNITWTNDAMARAGFSPKRGRDESGNTFCYYKVSVYTVLTTGGYFGVGMSLEEALSDAGEKSSGISP
jgi:hypothetical protein